jgi:hypothetical protein
MKECFCTIFWNDIWKSKKERRIRMIKFYIGKGKSLKIGGLTMMTSTHALTKQRKFEKITAGMNLLLFDTPEEAKQFLETKLEETRIRLLSDKEFLTHFQFLQITCHFDPFKTKEKGLQGIHYYL